MMLSLTRFLLLYEIAQAVSLVLYGFLRISANQVILNRWCVFLRTSISWIPHNGKPSHCKLSNSGASPRDFRFAVKIKPHLFYNPQLRVYHSKLVATIYTGSGHFLGTYVGEAQQQGFTSVDMSIKFHLNKVYTSAMQQFLTKLQLNQLHDTSDGQAKLPCGMIGAQGEERVNFY